MQITSVCVVVLLVAGLSSALPRAGYFPRSYMMGGGFYASPRYVREDAGYEYLPPPGQMTAMVVGDTVATNSFAGGSPYVPPRPNIQLAEEITEKPQAILAEPESVNETDHEDEPETLFSLEEATTEIVVTTKAPVATTKAPLRKVKVGKAKRPVPTPKPVKPTEETVEEQEEELPGSWPFAGKSGVPSYNAFFPIFISGSRGRSRAGQEEAFPGSATAIANAFSTGKGGVATSHATAFGDPNAAAFLRNSGYFNGRGKKVASSEE